MVLGAETSHWSLCWIPLHKNHSNQSPSIPLVPEDSGFQPQYRNPFLVTPFLHLHNDSDPGQIWLCHFNLKSISGYSRSLGEERLSLPPRYKGDQCQLTLLSVMDNRNVLPSPWKTFQHHSVTSVKTFSFLSVSASFFCNNDSPIHLPKLLWK